MISTFCHTFINIENKPKDLRKEGIIIGININSGKTESLRININNVTSEFRIACDA
jgi:hypothetical protein